MSAQALVKEYIEAVWNQGNLAALERLTSPGFTYVLAGQEPRDRSGMREFLEMTRAAFPDWRAVVLDMVTEGDMVAVRWEGRVTHGGTFHGIPATGRQVAVSGINMYRIADGRIAAEWEQMDSLGLLRQLGIAVPPPGRSTPDG